MASIDFVNHLNLGELMFGEIKPLIKNRKIFSNDFLMILQRMCVSDEVTLLSNGISKNFAKIMLCLRDMGQVEKYCIGNGQNSEEEFKQIK